MRVTAILATLAVVSTARAEGISAEVGLAAGPLTHERAVESFLFIPHAALRYRHWTGLEAGVLGQYGVGVFPPPHGELGLFAVEARYHPFDEEGIDPWIALAFGTGWTRDFISSNEAATPVYDDRWSGPVFLVSFGAELRISHHFALSAWVAGTAGLWTHRCEPGDPYWDLDRCLNHTDSAVEELGLALSYRFGGR